MSAGDLCQPSGPDGEGQARGQSRNARGEPHDANFLGNIHHMPETEDKPGDGEKKRDSIFGNWTSDDSKLLIITIAATVVANIFTVILVALTVIVARSMRPNPGTPGSYVFFFGSSLLPLIGVWMILSFLRATRRGKEVDLTSRVIKWIIIAVGILEGFFALLYVLGMIGFAVGVK